MKKIISLFLVVISLSLSGCASVGLGSDEGERSARAVMDDASITTAIKTKYLADKYIKGLTIDIDTFDRVVTLNGTVITELARDHAESIARNTRGVADVVNNLKVAIN